MRSGDPYFIDRTIGRLAWMTPGQAGSRGTTIDAMILLSPAQPLAVPADLSRVGRFELLPHLLAYGANACIQFRRWTSADGVCVRHTPHGGGQRQTQEVGELI